MSTVSLYMKKLLWSFMTYGNFKKALPAKLVLLHGLNILSFITIVKAEYNEEFSIPCTTHDNCTAFIGDVMCDLHTEKCICANGSVQIRPQLECLRYVGLGEYCQKPEQCLQIGPNFTCSKWTFRCQCIPNYIETEKNGMKVCIKSRQTENVPYFVHFFSGVDTVHIVLGCLTSALALLACCAGIIQLVRKKWTRPRCSNDGEPQFSPDLGFSTTSAPSQSQPYSDSQFTSSPLSGGDFAIIDGNTTAPPTPGTLGDEDYVVTPPPTYEEALKQSGPAKAGSTTTV